MSRTFTAVSFDLQFEVLSTPPACRAVYTNADESGRETHGHADFYGDAAQRIWDASGKNRLAVLGAEVEAREAEVNEPGAVAERVAAANEAEARARAAQAAQKVAEEAKAMANDAALEAEAKRAVAEAEHARLSLELEQMRAVAEAERAPAVTDDAQPA